MIYLDNAATTPLHPEVLASMMPFLTENYANPSAVYRPADEARKAIREAGNKIAAFLECKPTELFFTGSGTEADNMVILGLAANSSKKHIITTQVEHPAVLNACKYLEGRGYRVSYLAPDSEGNITVESLKKLLTPDTALVSIMYANNEIGTIMPVGELCRLTHEAGALFHTDAVQAFGQIPLSIKQDKPDFLSCSAHKIGGPKGVGLLYKRENLKLEPIMFGGGQQRGQRPGTENVAGIVGFGKAVELAARRMENREYEKEAELRDYFAEIIKKRYPEIIINGSLQNRLPGNLNISVRGLEAETLLVMLSAEGVCASGGSACSSNSGKPSHVLTAIGADDERIRGALRFSLGPQTTKSDIEAALEIFSKVYEKANKFHN